MRMCGLRANRKNSTPPSRHKSTGTRARFRSIWESNAIAEMPRSGMYGMINRTTRLLKWASPGRSSKVI